jgi:hypothetical protein
MQSVIYALSFMLRVANNPFMLSALMLRVVMLNVVAPLRGASLGPASALLTNVRLGWKGLPGIADWAHSGNTEGGSITAPLISCLTGLESAV